MYLVSNYIFLLMENKKKRKIVEVHEYINGETSSTEEDEIECIGSFRIDSRFISDIKKIVRAERDVEYISSIIRSFSELYTVPDETKRWSYSMEIDEITPNVFKLWLKDFETVPNIDIILNLWEKYKDRMNDAAIHMPDIAKNVSSVMICLYISDMKRKKRSEETFMFTHWRKNFFKDKLLNLMRINSHIDLPKNMESHIRVLTFISDVINNKEQYMRSIETHLAIDSGEKIFEIKFVGIDSISLMTLLYIASFQGVSREDVSLVKFRLSKEYISFKAIENDSDRPEMSLFVSYV